MLVNFLSKLFLEHLKLVGRMFSHHNNYLEAVSRMMSRLLPLLLEWVQCCIALFFSLLVLWFLRRVH